jgi:hypothetical protein
MLLLCVVVPLGLLHVGGECMWQILEKKGLMRICGFFRC